MKIAFIFRFSQIKTFLLTPSEAQVVVRRPVQSVKQLLSTRHQLTDMPLNKQIPAKQINIPKVAWKILLRNLYFRTVLSALIMKLF